MNKQEIQDSVMERLKIKLSDLEQEYSPKITETVNEINTLEVKAMTLIKKINSMPKQNPIIEFLHSSSFILIPITIGIILLLQEQIVLLIFVGIFFIGIAMILSLMPSVNIIKSRQKLEANHNEIIFKIKNLKDSKDRVYSQLENDKQALVNRANYIISILTARLECENLKTKLAYLVLEEFSKIRDRLELGISYSEMASFFTNAKFAVSQFKLSPDYQTCELLSICIDEAMMLYQYSIEAMKNVYSTTTNAWETADSDTKLRRILRTQFNCVDTDGNREYLVQLFWRLASKKTDKIQQILDTSDYMQFLNSRLNLGQHSGHFLK